MRARRIHILGVSTRDGKATKGGGCILTASNSNGVAIAMTVDNSLEDRLRFPADNPGRANQDVFS